MADETERRVTITTAEHDSDTWKAFVAIVEQMDRTERQNAIMLLAGVHLKLAENCAAFVASKKSGPDEIAVIISDGTRRESIESAWRQMSSSHAPDGGEVTKWN